MNLPPPSAEASAHSRELVAAIGREIGARGGWIPFAHYMEMALYEPGLGYYSAGARKFGVAGDFVTAPEMSAFFGRALATPGRRGHGSVAAAAAGSRRRLGASGG